MDRRTPETTSTEAPLADELERPEWLPADRWPFSLRRYAHPGPGRARTIHYTDEGSGPVLVLVHAGLWSFVWRDAIDRLRRDFRCITLDFPGSGLSEGEADDAGLGDAVDVLGGLLEHRGVGRATFVVHDLGGVVGVVAAARRHLRPAGLVAVNTFAWPPQGRGLTTMLGLVGSRPATSVLGGTRAVPRLSSSRMGVGRRYDRDDRAAFLGPYRRRDGARAFHRTMRSATESTGLFDAARDALRAELAGLPVLTVFGERNDPFGFARTWHSLFPSAQSWEVPGGNHFPMCDDPEGFAERVVRWYSTEVAPPGR